MDEIITQNKFCTKCKTHKELKEFGNDKTRLDGKRQWCKSCRLECARKWRFTNRDKINESLRSWYNAHPGKNREYHEKWISENFLQNKESNRKWKMANKEKVRESRRNRRAREKACEGKITVTEWNEVLEKYDNKCLCCGRGNIKLTMDHVLPLVLGGAHTIENVQPLCLSCNSKKYIKIIDYRMRK